MKYGLITLLALTLAGCTNDHVTALTDLNGKWVDVSTRTDTLTFGPFGGEQSMILGRGTELRNGHLLPKFGSGLYKYELLPDDRISLRWMFSSNSNPNEYYFKQRGDEITIEKFFETPTAGTMLIFKKLH